MKITIEFNPTPEDSPEFPERVAISDTSEAKLVRRILDIIGKYDNGGGVLKQTISRNGGKNSSSAERDDILEELEDYGIIVRDPRNQKRLKLNRRWRYEA